MSERQHANHSRIPTRYPAARIQSIQTVVNRLQALFVTANCWRTNTISRFPLRISSSLFPFFLQFLITPRDGIARRWTNNRDNYRPRFTKVSAAVTNQRAAILVPRFSTRLSMTVSQFETIHPVTYAASERGVYIFFRGKKKKSKRKKKNKSTAAAAESDYLRDQSSRVCVSSRSFSAVGQWSEFLRTFFTITSYAILCLGSRVIDELQQDRNASLHRRLNSVRSFALFHHFFLFFLFAFFYFPPCCRYIYERSDGIESSGLEVFFFFSIFFFFFPSRKT